MARFTPAWRGRWSENDWQVTVLAPEENQERLPAPGEIPVYVMSKTQVQPGVYEIFCAGCPKCANPPILIDCSHLGPLGYRLFDGGLILAQTLLVIAHGRDVLEPLRKWRWR